MSVVLIQSNPTIARELPANPDEILHIAEFFYDTVQGEGINIGVPAAFLRLQHCTLSCVWCDTKQVWRYGNPYSFAELCTMIEVSGLLQKLRNGQHLVLTGGSPLRQQTALIYFIRYFNNIFGFTPYIEIENECTLMPSVFFEIYVSCWNNSPKLSSSGNRRSERYKPVILSKLASYENSWFKFVVSCVTDWEEIRMDFLDTNLISKDQIILMPQGATREELFKNRQVVVDMAIKYSVRYSTREHIVLWDKMTGV